MRDVLVFGGYGGFGGRVAVLLARAGFAVVVAGRSATKADAFCARHSDLSIQPLVLDRSEGLGGKRPWLVVDAAGPFQSSGYGLPRSCIEAGSHYLDLADARDFVAGIGALDDAAKAAGVVVLSGASSVPALSTAACDRLAMGLDRVTLIDMALTASNRITGGGSVTRAILSYVGRPIQIWRGQAWRRGHGWQEIDSVRYAVSGRPPLVRRTALAEVPDLDFLPARYPGRPATRFRAGTEVDLQNLILWLLSWPVRWGWVRNLLGLTWPAVWTQRAMARIGGDRSAFSVLMKGWRGETPVTRRWTTIAEQGDGPWIPALAIPLIAARLDGQPPGARTAAGILALDDFAEQFARLAIFTHLAEEPASPLYARLMGEEFERLPSAVRALHRVNGDLAASGMAEVVRGKGLLTRIIGAVMRFPPTGVEVPVSVWMREENGIETWRRDFGGAAFSSRLSERNGRLNERFGPLRFAFDLRREADGLSMHFARWWIGPLRMPLFLAPRGVAREYEQDGRFHFDVPIALPLVGPVIHYKGWLIPPAVA